MLHVYVITVRHDVWSQNQSYMCATITMTSQGARTLTCSRVLSSIYAASTPAVRGLGGAREVNFRMWAARLLHQSQHMTRLNTQWCRSMWRGFVSRYYSHTVLWHVCRDITLRTGGNRDITARGRVTRYHTVHRRVPRYHTAFWHAWRVITLRPGVCHKRYPTYCPW